MSLLSFWNSFVLFFSVHGCLSLDVNEGPKILEIYLTAYFDTYPRTHSVPVTRTFSYFPLPYSSSEAQNS